MIVVSNTSPLTNLAAIGQFHLLQELTIGWVLFERQGLSAGFATGWGVVRPRTWPVVVLPNNQ